MEAVDDGEDVGFAPDERRQGGRVLWPERHADHHAHPALPYVALRHHDDSPQLPSGYAGMITLAYVSPLWFALMNKRVIRHYKGDLERIQFAPSKREALMKKYAAFAADVKAGRA